MQLLGKYEWQHFGTFTTAYELTLPSARRTIERYHKALKQAGKCTLFWVAEPFDLKDGFHLHGLMDAQNHLDYIHLIRIWQKITGKPKYWDKDENEMRAGKLNRIQLQRYDPLRGARGYCAKYMFKANCDYDILL